MIKHPIDLSTPAPTPKSRFFPELESARGIAALLVAGFHCGQAPTLIAGATGRLSDPREEGFWELPKNLYGLLVSGTGFPHHGVLFFFVLSGFVLTDSLLQGPAGTGRAAGRFFIARFFRIYPAIAGTILVFLAAHAFLGLALDPNGYSASSIVRNIALLQTNIDGVMWTLQVEILALPLIFAAFVLHARVGIGAVAAFALALTLLGFGGPWARLVGDWPSRTQWLFAFLFGVLSYHLGRQAFQGMRKRSATILFLASVVVFFLVGTAIHKVWEIIFKGAAAGAILGLLAFAPRITASALLRTGPLRFLGRISYSFYLLHPLTLAVIWKQPALLGGWIERGVPTFLIMLALWLGTTVAILPLAWLMYRAVELPFIRLGKHLWKRVSAPRNPTVG